MTEKNEKPVEPKPTTEAKGGAVKPAGTQSTLSEQQEQEQPSSSSNQGAVAGNLAPELTELVTELRETPF